MRQVHKDLFLHQQKFCHNNAAQNGRQGIKIKLMFGVQKTVLPYEFVYS
jgi:hypothetical protein